MSTPNLAIAHIVASQTQKEVTANTALDDLDTTVTDQQVVNMAGAADVTAAAGVIFAYNLKLTGAITANIHLKLPASKKAYAITNATTGTNPSTGNAYTVTVITTAGGSTGIAVPQGYTQQVYSDGTNVIALGAAINATPLLYTGDIPIMTGDSGSGGAVGLCPAPLAGDTAANKFLSADGAFAVVDQIATGPINISSANLLALTAGVPLIATPGPNKWIVPTACYVRYKYGSTPYTVTASEQLVLWATNGLGVVTGYLALPETGVFDQSHNMLGSMYPLASPAVTFSYTVVYDTEAHFANSGLSLGNLLGNNMTAGNGTATIWIWYRILTLV